jgi:hypothetical protein
LQKVLLQHKKVLGIRSLSLLSLLRHHRIILPVYMPRRDYLKYFAKGDDGNYVGTEPQKSYTDQELDEMFAQYVPPP